MSLSVDKINQMQFNTKMRGYNTAEVDDFVKEVSQTVQELVEQNRALQEKVTADEGKLKYFSELKDSLNKSILVAQEAADKVKNNAKREADIMVREAQKQATDIVSTANEKANQIVESAAESTRKLTVETNDLKKQTRIFRQRLQVMLESQLEVVKSDEWDKLLANDDLDKYSEIQNILGAHLDNNSDESVESVSITTSNFQSEMAPQPDPSSFEVKSNQAIADRAEESAESVESSEEKAVETETEEVPEADTSESSLSGTPAATNDDNDGQTVVVFPDNNN
ncbi:DivIVA domain-containing protein [Lactobacillaceae bacterium 24-114]